MARRVVFDLIGNNRSSSAFRGAARDADHTADRLDHLGSSADGASGRFSVLGKESDRAGSRLSALTGRTATLAAGLLSVAPAAGAAGAAAAAAAGTIAAAYGTAGAAIGAFVLAAKPQLTAVGQAAQLHAKAQEAAAQGGEKAAKANAAYAAALAKLPPATRDTAKAFIGLQGDFKRWSDGLAGDTMPIFTRGINVARNLLPKLTPLVKTASHALSDFMGSIEKGSKGKGFASFIGRINEAAKKVLPALLRSAKNVGVGLAGIFDAFLPQTGAMAKGVEGLTAKFAKWGQSLKGSEGFRKFIDYVRASLPQLQTTFGNLIQIVINLAKAFAPMSGLSLELVKGFTAMLAALPPPVMTALATAFVAVTAALRIWIPLQTTLNILLDANPIGIIVLALAGLVGGLVLAYKHSSTFRAIVQAAWHGIQEVASRAWTNYIRPALHGLAGLMSNAVDTWKRLWPQLKGTLQEISDFFLNTLSGAINTVADSLGGIGTKATEAGQKLGLIGQGFQGAQQDGNSFLSWSTFFGAAIGQIFTGFSGAIIGGLVGYFWPTTKKTFVDGFSFLGHNVATFAAEMPARLGHSMTNAASAVASGMVRLKNALFNGLPPLRGGWTNFFNWQFALARRMMSLTAGAIGDFFSMQRRAWSNGVDAMGAAWKRLGKFAKDPVNFVIGTVFNRGIAGTWNKVLDWLHIPGMRLGKLPLLESGGTLNNPAAARPMKTNKPMAIVGEGNPRFPEYVIPTDPKYRGRAAALWQAAGGDLQMLAGGGVLGSVLGGIRKAAGKVISIGKNGLDLLANPGKIWDRLAAPVLDMSKGTGQGPYAEAVAQIPREMLGILKSAALQVVGAFKKGFGGDAAGVVRAAESFLGVGDDKGENNNPFTRAWGMPGAPWCAIFVSEAIKKAKAGKHYAGYPSAAVAGYAGAMQHVANNAGQPGFLGAYRGKGPGGWGHINVLTKNLGGGSYATIGGNEGPVVARGVRSPDAVLRPMASGGILGIFQQENLDPADRRDPFLRGLRTATYDRGGMLQPGYTLAYNGTGRAEPVFAMASGGKLQLQKHVPSLSPAQKAAQSLLGQIPKLIGASTSAIQSFFSKLTSNIRKYFSGSSERRMLGWAGALQKSMLSAATKAQAIADKIKQAQDYAASVTSSAREWASLSNLPAKAAAADILTGLQGRATSLSTFASQITGLQKRGLSKGLLQQIIAMGAGEGSNLAALLLGADPATFKKLNAAQSQIDKISDRLGKSAANAMYDSGRAAGLGFLSGLRQQQAALNSVMDDLAERLADGVRRSLGHKKSTSKKKPLKAHKFDVGGWLEPGWTLAYNGLGQPEPIFPSMEAAAAYGGPAGGGTARQVVQNIGPVLVSERADVDMLSQQLEFRARAVTW